jgi:hypothetical protein
MLAYLFSAALLIVAAIIIAVIPYFILFLSGKTQAETSSIFVVVVLSGSLGALFSAMMRLYNFEDLPKALVQRELEGLPGIYLLIYSLVPMVIGAIAAAVLYVAFAARLVTSNLIPEFWCRPDVGEGCTTFITFVSYWSPKAPEDFAKVLVWGFIAGFAERFVPDTLQTLARSASSRPAQSDHPSTERRPSDDQASVEE